MPGNPIRESRTFTLQKYWGLTNCSRWWYDGGGIYRHVYITVADPVHIHPWGVYLPSAIATETIQKVEGTSQLTASGTVSPFVTIVNTQTDHAAAVTVTVDILDNGVVIHSAKADGSIPVSYIVILEDSS